jgi:6-phosphofructokinase 1
MQNTLECLDRLGIGSLITIGGDGTAYSAYRLAEASGGSLRVVHVPKTIDNDLDLPHDISTFGFQTARHIGVEIVKNLMVDAKTTSRWYLVVAQGRKAGHLALSIGKAAGATISLIPEEFPRGTSLQTIVDIISGSIIKRLAHGRHDGIAMLAEGLVECVPIEELEKVTRVPRDPFGNIHVAKIKLGEILRERVEERLAQFNLKMTVVSKSIGYEVRCADPIPFDMEYTRDLGYCAARFIIEGGTNTMVSIQDGRFRPIPFADIIDLRNGKTRLRLVDIESDRYKIARTYMLRLKREDFEDPLELTRLANTAGVSPEVFRDIFAPLVARDRDNFRLTVPPDANVDPSA